MSKVSKKVIDADEETRRFFNKVYAWMFLGLVISALTAYIVGKTPSIYEHIILNQWIFILLIIIELLLVIYLVALIQKMSATSAIFAFLLYSFVTGLTLSIIFLAYTAESIGITFLITAGMFGFMSFYGYVTKTDLTKLGNILLMGLFGLIILSIINIFVQSSVQSFIISILGVIIFTGLTAYDVQKLKKMNILGNAGTEEDTKESIMGALALYLDFINLFLSLLRLFGKRK